MNGIVRSKIVIFGYNFGRWEVLTFFELQRDQTAIIMNHKPGRISLAILLIISMSLSGCALFKKNCDCPPVGKKRAAATQTIPHS